MLSDDNWKSPFKARVTIPEMTVLLVQLVAVLVAYLSESRIQRERWISFAPPVFINGLRNEHSSVSIHG